MLTNEEMQQVMDEYAGYLVQLSYLYVKDVQLAEDIVQESFIKYFKAPEKFEQRATLKTYLSRIVIHTSLDYLRSWQARKRMLLKLVQHESKSFVATPADAVQHKLEQTELMQHVLALSLKYREVIILFYYEDMTSLEIAELLTISENTVKTRLRRAREQLKARMNEQDWEVLRDE